MKEEQENKNLEERSYVPHVNNLGFRDINVPRGRHTALNFFLKTMKRGRRRKHNLHSKRRGYETTEEEQPTSVIGKIVVL